MSRQRTMEIGLSMGIIIAGLLTFIFLGIYYYLPKLDQRVDILSARVDATTTTPTTVPTEKLTDLTPRLTELEKNYNTLVSVINTKMPNVNLPALLAIANTKGMSSANIALAIALIENEPAQAKTYLSQTLAFNENEVVQVMGPMSKYEKPKFLGFKFLHHAQ
jgi:hypothetical protein